MISLQSIPQLKNQVLNETSYSDPLEVQGGLEMQESQRKSKLHIKEEKQPERKKKKIKRRKRAERTIRLKAPSKMMNRQKKKNKMKIVGR